MRLRRVSVISGMAAAIVGVVFAATAFACTALATLQTASPTAPAGTNVVTTGSAFATKGAGPVILHWNGIAGPEVARAVPDANGSISTSVAVPKGADPGQYVLVATQAKANGEVVYGTPARASIAVVGPDGKVPTASPASPQNPVRAVPTADGGGVAALTLVLGFAGLALFGAGFVTLTRSGGRARSTKPVSATVRHD